MTQLNSSIERGANSGEVCCLFNTILYSEVCDRDNNRGVEGEMHSSGNELVWASEVSNHEQ